MVICRVSRGDKVSNKKRLKQYLIEGDNPFLLNENNNGKTIMLSGAWGAGKTHFWQNEIESILSEKLKREDKACVYVSLYGKDNLNTLKEEVYIKASLDNNIISSEVSTFGFDVLSSIKNSDLKIGSAVNAGANLLKSKKRNKGKNKIKDGGVICFDDFERKSNAISLNDLFGFISQLSLEMNCKVVIILNSGVFEGNEAEIFKQVKEKTINKFFYFKPTVDELFKSIYKDEKYTKLEKYKSAILDAIKETEELNARLYIQVLDNCLEWNDKKQNLDNNIVRVLVLTTINFVLNHMLLDYQEVIMLNRKVIGSSVSSFYDGFIKYKLIESYPDSIFCNNNFSLYQVAIDNKNNYSSVCKKKNFINIIKNIKTIIYDTSIDSDTGIKNARHTQIEQEELLKWLNNNYRELETLWKYGYQLYYVGTVKQGLYNEIADFIKTGILL